MVITQAYSLSIHSKNIDAILCETRLPDKFSGIIIAFIRIDDGRRFDVLFNKDENLIAPGTMDVEVSKMAECFGKTMRIGSLDGSPCWISELNNYNI